MNYLCLFVEITIHFFSSLKVIRKEKERKTEIDKWIDDRNKRDTLTILRLDLLVQRDREALSGTQ